MKVDRRHAAVIARAIKTDDTGGPTLTVDNSVVKSVCERLTLWEEGLVARCLRAAATSADPTPDQRALLAIFAYRGEAAP